MERVAVITDIHANLPALEAVLEAIESTDVDAVYCGGDLVGYGPHPNEVCALIEDRDPYPNAVQSANWTGVGICAHESALRGGEIVRPPAFTRTWV